MILTSTQKAVVLLDAFEKLEYKKKAQLIGAFSSPEKLFTLEKDNKRLYARFEEVFPSVAAVLRKKDLVEEMINSAVKGADGVITLFDDGYPENLKNTPVPPLVLYYKGNADLLKGNNRVAIVGSRKTMSLYYAEAERVSKELSEAGVTVVTGIADGGDDAAIKGAIKSGRIISVFAGGLNCGYGQYKSALVNEIARNGLLLTEYPADRPARDFTYPVRNRIIAGLSRAAIIVSGTAKSGARYTAAYAADYGREVLTFPYGLGVKSGELCNGLIKQGATVIENAEDAANALGIELNEKKQIKLEGNELVIYESIAEGVGDANKLVEKTGLKPYEVVAALGMLEMKGALIRSGAEYEIVK